MALPDARTTAAHASVLVALDADAPLPAWAGRVGASPLSPAALADAQAGAAALDHAECVLVPAESSGFVAIARRIHALDPAIQVVVVAGTEAVPAIRRSLLFAPGLGEVWVASPDDVPGAMARAAGVTRQRRRFARTRAHLERDRVAASPQRAERALVSDAYLAALLQVLPDAVFSTDEVGRVLSANQAAERMLAGPAGSLVGRRLGALLLGTADASSVSDAALLERACGSEPLELDFVAADGARRTGELRATALQLPGVAAWAVVLRDVTEQHATMAHLRSATAQLEASNEALQSATEELMQRTEEAERAAQLLRESEAGIRAMADALPTLAWTARPDGYIDWYNGRWYEYTGTTPAQMEGWGWQSVHDPDVLPAVLAGWMASIHTGQPFEMTFPLRAANGEFRAFLTRVVPVRESSGHIVRWVGTNTDVQAERDARERADEANRAKSQFLANMSHELRTPLNAIGGYVQLLEEGIYGPLTEGQRASLARVQRAQHHLLGLINDVLNFAKLENGRVEYELETLDAAELAADVATLMAPQFELREVRFATRVPATSGDPLRVCADRDKVRQVLLNLLSNAAKFTEAGGEVRLEVAAEGASQVALRVHDTGRGIPADRLEAIFEPFVQVRAQYGTSNEGTGLGLAISRDLARGMGGDLTVASVLGEGSTFTLLLPRRD